MATTVRPRNVAELKKNLGITSDFTLCADCPQATWEAAETEKEDNSDSTTRKLEALSPLITEPTKNGYVHMACYCTAKGKPVSLPITYCQTYEQAMAEMEA